MKRRKLPKPKPARRNLPDYRNVTRGARLLAEMIEKSQQRDEEKQSK